MTWGRNLVGGRGDRDESRDYSDREDMQARNTIRQSQMDTLHDMQFMWRCVPPLPHLSQDDDLPVPEGSDLKSYLNTLNVAGGGGRAGGSKAAKLASAAMTGGRGGPLPRIMGGQQQQQRGGPQNKAGIPAVAAAAAPPTPAQPYDPSIPPQFQHLPHRAVKAAMQVVDRMVAQAIRSGEVRGP